MKDLFKKIITDFHEGFNINPVERDLEINFKSGLKKIITIYGPRRAGKTYFLYSQINKLIRADKYTLSDIIYINFEDNRLIELNAKELDQILAAYSELFPDKTPILFFDEIQNVKGWSKWLRRLNDDGFRIFVTGSNSRFLSKEIATELRGRTFSYQLLPFSLKEYFRFKGIEISDNDKFSTRKMSAVSRHLKKYIEYGGFPEVLISEPFETNTLLSEYINSMLYRDIIERYGVKNVYVIKFLINYILENYGTYFSINKIYNFLISQNIKTGKDILYNYFQHLEDSLFVFQLEKMSGSIKKSVNTFRKIYLSDVGYARAGKAKINYGRAFENVVYLELLRRGHDIHLYKNDFECDFIVKSGKKILPIQVCYKLKDKTETYQREISSLMSTMKKLNVKKGYIVTLDESDVYSKSKYEIITVPVIDFLFFEKIL